MKDTYKIIVLIVTATNIVIAGDYSYRIRDRQIDLQPSPNLVVIEALGSDSPVWQDVYLRHPYLDTSYAPLLRASGLWQIRVADTADHSGAITGIFNDTLLAFASPVLYRADSSYVIPTGRLILRFSENLTNEQVDSIISEFNLTRRRMYFQNPSFISVELPNSPPWEPFALAESLAALPEVLSCTPDFIEQAFPQADPLQQYQWHLNNTGQTGGTAGADIGILAADQYFAPNYPMLVAILDDGFEAHEDFPASQFADGYDYYFGEDDESPAPFGSHGMPVLGAFAAVTGNDIGIRGALRDNWRVLGQKIFYAHFDNGLQKVIWDIDWDGAISALSDAVDSGAAVVNMSWRYFAEMSEEFTVALEAAHDIGVLLVCGSGNEHSGSFCWPAWLDCTFTVGGTTHLDQKWYYSNFGPKLDVVATGGSPGLYTLDRPGSAGRNSGFKECYSGEGTATADYDCNVVGTSLSSAVACGVASLVISRRPDLAYQPDVLMDVLRYSAVRTIFGRPADDTAWVADSVGWGRVDAERALLAVVRGDADNNGLVSISDAVYMITYIFYGGPLPVPNPLTGDTDCSGSLSISDAVFLINYIYAGGPAPGICYNY